MHRSMKRRNSMTDVSRIERKLDRIVELLQILIIMNGKSMSIPNEKIRKIAGSSMDSVAKVSSAISKGD